MSVRLGMLLEKEEGVIEKIDKNGLSSEASKRLSNLGFNPGTRIRVTQSSPNYRVRVKGVNYCLSKDIVENIYVKKRGRHRHRYGRR